MKLFLRQENALLGSLKSIRKAKATLDSRLIPVDLFVDVNLCSNFDLGVNLFRVRVEKPDAAGGPIDRCSTKYIVRASMNSNTATQRGILQRRIKTGILSNNCIKRGLVYQFAA